MREVEYGERPDLMDNVLTRLSRVTLSHFFRLKVPTFSYVTVDFLTIASRLLVRKLHVQLFSPNLLLFA